MSHLIKKLKEDLDPSVPRVWYNDWVENNINGSVLDVGKSKYWDYSSISYFYKTVDSDKKMNPDILEDICNNSICTEAFDYVLCNGMYEFVSDPQKMVDEVWRILDKKGTAVFGFVGKNYKPYKKDWKYYDNNLDFSKFKILKKKDFNNYNFIIVKKWDNQIGND